MSLMQGDLWGHRPAPIDTGVICSDLAVLAASSVSRRWVPMGLSCMGTSGGMGLPPIDTGVMCGGVVCGGMAVLGSSMILATE